MHHLLPLILSLPFGQMEATSTPILIACFYNAADITLTLAELHCDFPLLKTVSSSPLVLILNVEFLEQLKPYLADNYFCCFFVSTFTSGITLYCCSYLSL